MNMVRLRKRVKKGFLRYKRDGIKGVCSWGFRALWTILWFHTRRLISALPDIELRNNRRKKKQLLDLQPDDIFLDIGSREGNDSARLNRPCCHICMDLDLPAIRQGRRRYPFLQFVVADARYLPFRDSSISKILASELFEHVTDYHLIFHEIERVGRPDTILVTSTPHGPTLQHYRFPILRLCRTSWIHRLCTSKNTVLRWFFDATYVTRGGYEAWKSDCGHVRDGLSLSDYHALAGSSEFQIARILFGYKTYPARVLWEVKWLICPASWKFFLWLPHSIIHFLERYIHKDSGFNILLKWTRNNEQT